MTSRVDQIETGANLVLTVIVIGGLGYLLWKASEAGGWVKEVESEAKAAFSPEALEADYNVRIWTENWWNDQPQTISQDKMRGASLWLMLNRPWKAIDTDTGVVDMTDQYRLGEAMFFLERDMIDHSSLYSNEYRLKIHQYALEDQTHAYQGVRVPWKFWPPIIYDIDHPPVYHDTHEEQREIQRRVGFSALGDAALYAMQHPSEFDTLQLETAHQFIDTSIRTNIRDLELPHKKYWAAYFIDQYNTWFPPDVVARARYIFGRARPFTQDMYHKSRSSYEWASAVVYIVNHPDDFDADDVSQAKHHLAVAQSVIEHTPAATEEEHYGPPFGPPAYY